MKHRSGSCLWPFLPLAFALLVHSTVIGEEVVPTSSYSGGMGSVTVDGQQFYRINFRPDIPIGAWGVALDVELFIDEEGGFSDRSWRFGTGTEAFDTFLRKLYYVRYGRPGSDTFVKVGALDDVTLGYGLIMKRYRNTLQYPGIKKTGLQFELKNLGTMGIGVQGVVNNFQDFEAGGALVGLRLSAKPAGKLEFGLTYVVDLDQYGGLLDSDDDGVPDAVDAFPNNDSRSLDNDGDGVSDEQDSDDDNDGVIDVDAGSGLPDDVKSALAQLNSQHGDAVFPIDADVSRKNPFNRDRVDRDRFSMLGFDASYPLVSGSALQLRLYGQLAMLLDDDDELSLAESGAQGVQGGNRKAEGLGVAAPGLWLKAGPLNGQIEFRHFRDDFDSGYFDNLYELDRARIDVATGLANPKDALLRRNESASGIYGGLSTDISQIITAAADYQYLTGGDNTKQQVHASARISKEFLKNIPRLTMAQAYYQKNNIGARLNQDGDPGSEDDFFESTEDTFYGYLLGLEMAGGVSVRWDTRYVFSRDSGGELDRDKIMTIETVFNF